MNKKVSDSGDTVDENPQVRDSRAASLDDEDLELFDKDGNKVDTSSLVQRMLNHPLTKEMYGMNKTALANQSKTKLGEVIINLVEYKMIRPFLPESATKALDSKVVGAIFRLFLSQGIGFSLAVLSNYVPEGKFRKAANIGAEAVINGGWDSAIDPEDVSKFLLNLFSGDVFKLMGNIDPSLLDDKAK